MEASMIKVGDRLLLVEPNVRSGGAPRLSWIRVIKVGRIWAEYQPENRTWRCKDDRFNMETMRGDGGGFGATARVYADEATYHAATRADELWRELRKRFDRLYQRPPHLDEIGVLKAADALGIKLDSE
jgi:hypothetical protein